MAKKKKNQGWNLNFDYRKVLLFFFFCFTPTPKFYLRTLLLLNSLFFFIYLFIYYYLSCLIVERNCLRAYEVTAIVLFIREVIVIGYGVIWRQWVRF